MIRKKSLWLLLGMFMFSCEDKGSLGFDGYQAAEKSECRAITLTDKDPASVNDQETTDEILINDDDIDDSGPTREDYKARITLVSQEEHRLMFVFTTPVHCGKDLLYYTKTEVDAQDITMIDLRFKIEDTDPNAMATCSCMTDFAITINDAKHDLSIVKKVVVFFPDENPATFEL